MKKLLTLLLLAQATAMNAGIVVKIVDKATDFSRHIEWYTKRASDHTEKFTAEQTGFKDRAAIEDHFKSSIEYISSTVGSGKLKSCLIELRDDTNKYEGSDEYILHGFTFALTPQEGTNPICFRNAVFGDEFKKNPIPVFIEIFQKVKAHFSDATEGLMITTKNTDAIPEEYNTYRVLFNAKPEDAANVDCESFLTAREIVRLKYNFFSRFSLDEAISICQNALAKK